MARLDTDRQDKLEPKRMEYAVKQLTELGFDPNVTSNDKAIRFQLNGNTITLYPYSGYFNGKGVNPGRGIKYLLDQLKNNGSK